MLTFWLFFDIFKLPVFSGTREKRSIDFSLVHTFQKLTEGEKFCNIKIGKTFEDWISKDKRINRGGQVGTLERGSPLSLKLQRGKLDGNARSLVLATKEYFYSLVVGTRFYFL